MVDVPTVGETTKVASQTVAAHWRWPLALGCVFGPVAAVLILMVFFSQVIAPLQGSGRLSFSYSAASPTNALGVQAVKPAATETSSSPQPIVPDATIFLSARNYAGRVAFALVSGFLAIVALATLLFSSTIFYRLLKGLTIKGREIKGLAALALLFAVWVGAAIIARWTGVRFDDTNGRYFVVRDLLNAADSFANIGIFTDAAHGGAVPTGKWVEHLLSIDIVVGVMPIVVLLAALVVLTWRAPESGDEPALRLRLTLLRCLVGLASASFVMGVMCAKAVVEWPLTLVAAGQALALRPIADSQVLQFGALATAGIFAAFAPAIVAWSQDVNALRQTADDKEAADKLAFAPSAYLASIVAIVAPLLASPVVDSVRSVVGALAK